MKISQYECKGDTFYQVHVWQRDGSGKKHQRKRKNIRSIKEAKTIGRQLSLEVTKSILEQEQGGKKWGELVEGYELAARANMLYHKQITLTTLLDQIGALKIYTESWWQMPASKIERYDIHEVFKLMDLEQKSYARKKNVKSAINSVFEWAINAGMLSGVAISPASNFSIGKRSEKEPEILNGTEIAKFLSLANSTMHPWYPVWAFALLTGMRNGELFALLWTDIDWESRTITVSKSFNGRTKSIKSTKNGLYRYVPINNEDLLLILKELKLSSKGRPEVLPRLPRWFNGEAARILRTFLKGYGLPSVCFHALRACFATQLLKNGIPLPQVQKICGWSDLKTTQRYLRLSGVEIAGATDCLKILPDADALGKVLEFQST